MSVSAPAPAVASELPLLPALPPEPLVSVLIVNYNYARYLPEAIDSVLAQTYQNFEVVICDDGSTDNSPKVIAEYAARDTRIKGVVRPNTGMAGALNDSFAASSGDIIAMLDADDVFTERKLERVVQHLRGSGRTGIVFHTLTKVDSDGRPLGRMPQFGNFDGGELRDAILTAAGHFAGAPNSAIAMRRECAELVFPLPAAEFRSEADGYLRAAGALFYAVTALDEPLTLYRVHSENLTASASVDLKWAEKTLSATRRIGSALGALAARHGWSGSRLEDNPGYCEARVIRDYLQGASRTQLVSAARDLRRACSKLTTPDGPKARTKAALLSCAVLLPRFAGMKVMEQIYLPSPLKRVASRVRGGGAS